MDKELKINGLMEKIEKLKGSKEFDLSTEEDLSIAIMNLISLEEHFFFSGSKTRKTEYFDMLLEVREIRKKLLARMMDKNEGESWCISKHLLAATMRLMEVGTKLQSDNKKEEAKETFAHAYEVYSMFWALRLKIINPSDYKKKDKADMADTHEGPWTSADIINKLIDCCDEK